MKGSKVSVREYRKLVRSIRGKSPRPKKCKPRVEFNRYFSKESFAYAS